MGITSGPDSYIGLATTDITGIGAVRKLKVAPPTYSQMTAFAHSPISHPPRRPQDKSPHGKGAYGRTKFVRLTPANLRLFRRLHDQQVVVIREAEIQARREKRALRKLAAASGRQPGNKGHQGQSGQSGRHGNKVA